MSDMYRDCDIVGPDTMRLQWSEEDPVTVFWREDEECSHYQTRFLARHSPGLLPWLWQHVDQVHVYTCTTTVHLYTELFTVQVPTGGRHGGLHGVRLLWRGNIRGRTPGREERLQ